MTRTRWDIFALALFSGVLSGLQVGKAPPALPMMRVDLGLDLVTAGWVTSIYYGVGALCGVAAGLAADTLGPRRLLFAGMVCMGFGSLLGAYAGDGTSLLLTRFLEGLGFVAVTVTAPKIIAAAASPADRNLVFGIWGTYMPIGMAMSLLIAPILLTAWGWQGLWLANAGLIGLFALPEVFNFYATREKPHEQSNLAGKHASFADYRRNLKTIIRGSLIGVVLGAIPGIDRKSVV